jgi:hypothetical protein
MASDPLAFPFADRLLAQRLERAEARSSASFVEAHAALLEARLRHAAGHGCDLATMGALPDLEDLPHTSGAGL